MLAATIAAPKISFETFAMNFSLRARINETVLCHRHAADRIPRRKFPHTRNAELHCMRSAAIMAAEVVKLAELLRKL
jgi:hypothetical protein